LVIANMSRDKYVVAVGEARQAEGGKPSASPIYRAAASKDAFPKLECSTLFELFDNSVKKFGSNQCLGAREKLADGKVGDYVFQTYSEVAEEVSKLASGLRAIGVAPKNRVGVLGANCPEWMIAMQVRLLGLLTAGNAAALGLGAQSRS
jgi:long-chain acyl-CoA synthetase